MLALKRPLMRAVLACLAPLVLMFVLLHLAWGVMVAGLMFPWLPASARNALIRFWSRMVLAAFGVSLPELPQLPPAPEGRGRLLILNHVSWIDVFVVAALEPARFVAKAEIRAWPIAGWLAQGVGTVFIERGRRHAVGQVNAVIAQRLSSGQSIGIFPEGTTTDGSRLLRFHSNLIQPALDVGAQLVPVALRYEQDGARSDAAAYIDDMNLMQSIWRILTAPRLSCRVHFLAPIAPADQGRQAIAGHAHAAIASDLGLAALESAHAEPGADSVLARDTGLRAG
jgi:1-acyl-sn-glycerol-3-phosphate acyltransferase